MLHLTIPQIGEETKNTKDLVFTILSSEQPLSIIQIYNKIKRQYHVGITYQAVRKAIDALQKENVLKKKEKTYMINKQWVLDLKSFFDKLLTTYETKISAKLFHTEFVKEDYAIYTFNSLLDLDNFWGEMLLNIAKTDKSEKEFVGYYAYNFWFLINLGRETKLFDDFKKSKFKSYFLVIKDFALNRWGAGLYQSSGVKVKVKNATDIDPSMGLNIIGDTIIQVKYSQEITKKLETFFKTYKTVQEMKLQEITQIAHEPCDITFIMFKNPTLARNLREMYKAKILRE